MIEDLHDAVLEVLDHELDAVNVSWLLDEGLALLIFEHVVLFVQLFLLCRRSRHASFDTVYFKLIIF